MLLRVFFIGVELGALNGFLPTDHYLWLVGKAGELLRGRIRTTEKMPTRKA